MSFSHPQNNDRGKVSDFSKNTSGMPEISSSEMVPKRNYQQMITLNNMKGL
jgi:hypothetical protein